ncbi:MAG: 3-keto-5-aminohexanoate cleavage protein [Actinomycetota bacterium]|nr:3-keto-5-aminohexanoate cleavage protein [Actinomycetota bacterium]
MDPLIITVAGIGAELTRDKQPNLPITAAEIAADAAECAEAGASIYHLHVRADDGTPTMDVEVFRAALDAIRGATELIVQFTSGGAVTDSEDARIAPLALQPDMASLTTGSVNFGDEVFHNPAPLVDRFYARMRSLGIVPEFEIFEPGMIGNAERLLRDHGNDHHRHFDLVLGVPGAMPAWPDAIPFLAAHLPEDASWSATGIGRSYVQVAADAIGLGGHVRTGFEDVLYFEVREIATSNRQLVERVAGMAREAGRPVASVAQAREILGLEAQRGTLGA